MVWKKSFLSIIIYVLYFLGIGAAWLTYVYKGAVDRGQRTDLALVIACSFMVGVLVLFLLFRFVMRRLSAAILSHNSEWAGIAESVLFIAFITAGLALRIVNLDQAGESASYYEIAKVTGNGGIMEVTHGATFFYVYFLRILFLVVGNKWISGIWLQIVLQILAAVLLYVSVRKLIGAAAGLTFLGMMMFLPTEMIRGITYTPHVFYLVIYAAALLCVTFFLEQQVRGRKNIWSAGFTIVFSAVCVGLACYLDVTGLTLLVPVLFGLFVRKAKVSWEKRTISVLVLILMSILSWLGCLYLDAYVCNKGFLDILYAWIEMYGLKAQNMWFWYVGKEELTGFLTLGFMVFGAFAFWVSGKYQRYIPWIVMLFCVCVIEYFQISVINMDGKMMLLILGGILSGVGVQECICNGKKQETKEQKAVESALEMDDDCNKDVDNTQERTSVVEETKPDVKLIENPLPLPKKHVKKEINYKIQPKEELMHYDVEISENDDFDR